MTDKDLAQLQLGVYGQVAVAWDYFHTGRGGDDVVYGAKVIDGVTVIALRGSVTIRDWILDLFAFAPPVSHGRLGPVHPGFLCGMEAAWASVKEHTLAPRVFIGHSLGAGRVAVLTALAALDGQAPVARVVWGEPKSGFAPLAGIIAGVPARSYRNGDGRHHDLVTDVPISFPPEDYLRSGHLIDICAAPGPEITGALGIFAWHHMPLYAEATPGVLK
jgi:hypothetical protein